MTVKQNYIETPTYTCFICLVRPYSIYLRNGVRKQASFGKVLRLKWLYGSCPDNRGEKQGTINANTKGSPLVLFLFPILKLWYNKQNFCIISLRFD